MNFNRVFPGADTGGPATQLAYYISHVLMPIVDVVMDVHTGGSSMRIEPSSLATVNPAHPRHRERMEAMLAFMTPLSFVWVSHVQSLSLRLLPKPRKTAAVAAPDHPGARREDGWYSTGRGRDAGQGGRRDRAGRVRAKRFCVI